MSFPDDAIASRLHDIEKKHRKRQSLRRLRTFLSFSAILIGLLLSFGAANHALEERDEALAAQSELRSKLSASERALESSRADLSSAEARLNDLWREEARIDDLQTRLSSLQSQILTALSQRDSLEETVSSLESQRSITLSQLESATAQIEDLTGMLSEVADGSDFYLNQLVQRLAQRVVYQGDNQDFLNSGNRISFPCDVMVSDDLVNKTAPSGYTLARLDLITQVPGGTCGHSFFSATFLPETEPYARIP